jgi:hypothetical protein
MRPTVVCAPDYLPFWHTPASLPEPPVDERIRLLGSSPMCTPSM